jgi:alpha-beta hydrolase superfamily lysophospholipase
VSLPPFEELEGFASEALPIHPQGEGLAATLVRWQRRHAGAVLWLHGYNDYFFQGWLGPALDAAGWTLCALDQRRCGRSLRDGQVPARLWDLAEVYEELDLAVAALRQDHETVVLLGHSTGGLVATCWVDDRQVRGERPVDALVLNSPFFDFRGPRWSRWLAKTLIPLAARSTPALVVQQPGDDRYAKSLLRSLGAGGEWTYDRHRKIVGGVPVEAGWVAAVRAGHKRIKRGVRLELPILVLHPAAANRGDFGPEWFRTDTVLLPAKMAHYGRKLGPDVRVVCIEDGMHDLFLSRPTARQAALDALTGFLERW